MNGKIQKLAEALEKANNICVFTGAGISCPSGIPDFRSADGLYNGDGLGRFTPEQIISHSFFSRNPEMFYEFYKSKMMYPQAKPNKAHFFFAKLEKIGKTVSVVTQNIDGLHTDAGSSCVFEIHGSVRRNHCLKCGEFYDGDYVYSQKGVPLCSECGGLIKPDVVLYEESLDEMQIRGAVNAITSADLIFVTGTSLAVYPAASFLSYFRGETIVLVNKTATSFDGSADIVVYDDIVNVCTALEKELFI